MKSKILQKLKECEWDTSMLSKEELKFEIMEELAMFEGCIKGLKNLHQELLNQKKENDLDKNILKLQDENKRYKDTLEYINKTIRKYQTYQESSEKTLLDIFEFLTLTHKDNT